MNNAPAPPARRAWVSGVAYTLAVALLSFVIGFVWLPRLQGAVTARGWWDAICGAAGIATSSGVAAVAEQPGPQLNSRVVVTPQMMPLATADEIGRGATLALQCTMCHGGRGISNADSPNLAGQYAASIYKELRDFQSGARVSAIMTPRVRDLGDQDMYDLAAYYAFLPRSSVSLTSRAAPPLIAIGAPMRNIAPCTSCHGETAYKTGSAWLQGEPLAYLKSQLQAFATSARHNDIDGQMRNVARGMTPVEIEQTAIYYAVPR